MKTQTKVAFLLIVIAALGRISHAHEETGRLVVRGPDSLLARGAESAPDAEALSTEELESLLYEKSQKPASRTFRIVYRPNGAANASAADMYSGFVTCVINAQRPHKGKQSGTIKAKSGAACSYTHRSGSQPRA